MSSVRAIADKIRNSLVVLNMPIVIEMAIHYQEQLVYSDLSRASLGKISPFTESFMLLGLGDNLSLALDSGRTIVVSKISEKTVLIVVTSQKMGAVLAKLKEVAARFGSELDEFFLSQPVEAQRVQVIAPEEAAPPSGAVAEEVVPLPLPSPPPPPTPTIGTFMAPVLIDKTVVKSTSGDDRKILSLCTGRFSIEEISKKTKIPAKTVIETIYRYSEARVLELREEKKTAAEEAINFLKRI